MKGALWIAFWLLSLAGAREIDRDPMPLAIEATPAQFVDNCGRFHSGPDLFAPDREPTFPGAVQPSKDKGVA